MQEGYLYLGRVCRVSVARQGRGGPDAGRSSVCVGRQDR